MAGAPILRDCIIYRQWDQVVGVLRARVKKKETEGGGRTEKEKNEAGGETESEKGRRTGRRTIGNTQRPHG